MPRAAVVASVDVAAVLRLTWLLAAAIGSRPGLSATFGQVRLESELVDYRP